MRNYQFFDPVATMHDLQGDAAMLRRLAVAFLSEADGHILAIADCEQPIQDTAHRLRTAFGIFHAERGAQLSREIDLAYQDGRQSAAATRQALLTELIGMAEELDAFQQDVAMATCAADTRQQTDAAI